MAVLSSGSWRTRLVQAVAVLALYWLGAQIGFTFSGKGILTPVWPPAAVGAAAAILFGLPSLALVWVYIAVDFVGGDLGRLLAPNWAWVEPAGVLVAAALTRWLAQRLRFDITLGSLRAVLTLFALAFAYSLANGLTITAFYCGVAHSKHCAEVDSLAYLGESFISDFFGALVCLPALLGWLARWSPGADPDATAPRFTWPGVALGRFLAVALPCFGLAWLVTQQNLLPVDVVGFLVMPLLVFLLSMSVLTLVVHVAANQQQARAGEQATQLEKARIDLMLQSASEAVISFGADGRISYLNPAAAPKKRSAPGWRGRKS